MRVIEHNHDQLEIRPQLWAFFMPFGLIFFIVGLIVFLSFGQSSTLTCTRTTAEQLQCRISKSLLSREISDEPLEALKGAYVEDSTDSDGDITYRVVLRTGAGDVPLSKAYGSGYSQKQEIAREIETFVKNPGVKDFSTTQKGTTGLIMGGIFSAIGFLSLLGGTQTIDNAWYFDRTAMTATHIRRSILGDRSREWGLNEFEQAVVASHFDSDGDRTFRVELTTSMNERFPLTSWYSSGYRRKKKLAGRINEFLQGYR